jgi:general stress protein CsbA
MKWVDTMKEYEIEQYIQQLTCLSLIAEKLGITDKELRKRRKELYKKVLLEMGGEDET